jgi:RNA polymerase sigma factor (sigma-70 family)
MAAAPPVDAELESLVRRFSKLVRAAAARVGGAAGRQIADDVEQNVFLNLWKQLEREQTIDNPASYLYRCAIRETVRLLKQLPQTADETAALDAPATAPAPDDQLVARERRKALEDAMQSLPVDRRRAVQAYLAGFSVPETMKMYGWSYQRARNLSTRGMADLRAELRNRGIDG